jgi:hypothetical protein
MPEPLSALTKAGEKAGHLVNLMLLGLDEVSFIGEGAEAEAGMNHEWRRFGADFTYTSLL